MPRRLRTIRPGVVYHLIARFVAGEWFVKDDDDRDTYLRLLGRSLAETDWRCLAYAIMSNHIHLAVIAGAMQLAAWIRMVHSPFAEYVNRRDGRIGAVFTRGPSDHEVHRDGIATVIAYIHNNPVRAGVVPRARDSRWTSHAAYMGIAPAPPWLDIGEGLTRMEFLDRHDFERWVDTRPNEREVLELRDVRREARRHGAIELGSPVVGDGAGIEVPLLARSCANLRVDPREVVRITAEEVGVSLTELCSRRRTPPVLLGREVAVRAADELGICGVDIAASLAVSGQAITAIRRRSVDTATTALAARVARRLFGRKPGSSCSTFPSAMHAEQMGASTRHATDGSTT